MVRQGEQHLLARYYLLPVGNPYPEAIHLITIVEQPEAAEEVLQGLGIQKMDIIRDRAAAMAVMGNQEKLIMAKAHRAVQVRVLLPEHLVNLPAHYMPVVAVAVVLPG